jgi:hypothetical protein
MNSLVPIRKLAMFRGPRVTANLILCPTSLMRVSFCFSRVITKGSRPSV